MVNPDWQKRYRVLGRPEHFDVEITTREDLQTLGFTSAEYARLMPKLQLVAQFAARLAVAMLKGTVKYDSDDWSVEEWMDFEDDDTVDAINYRLLRTAAHGQANLALQEK